MTVRRIDPPACGAMLPAAPPAPGPIVREGLRASVNGPQQAATSARRILNALRSLGTGHLAARVAWRMPYLPDTVAPCLLLAQLLGKGS